MEGMKYALAMLVSLLSACGGGDPEPEPEGDRKTIIPVECTEDPKVCTSII